MCRPSMSGTSKPYAGSERSTPRARHHLRHRHVETLLHVEEATLASEAIRAIRNLPPRQRVIAVMHWVHGVPLVEIASALGISASAARTHLNRARNTARR